MAGPATPAPDLKYRLLLEISQKISQTFDLKTVLDELLASIRSVIDYDAAGIFVLNRSVPLARMAGNFLIAGVAKVGFDDSRPEGDPMLRSGKGIIGHVIRTGTTVVAPDVRLDPHYVEGRPSTLSEIAVPIVSNGEVIGALNLESNRLDAYSAADADLLEFFASAAAISIEKTLLHRQVLEKQQMEYQLRIARDVQTRLLPAGPPRMMGYDISGVNLATWEIGGDYYDYIPLSGGRLGLVMADVAGKGVAAALIMAGFRAALRTELRRQDDIRAAFEDVNRMLVESTEASRFVTAVYGVLDPGSGKFTYVQCGHNPPILFRGRGESELLDNAGLPLGVLREARYEPATATINPGDLLVLYTDGIIEVTDSNDAEFGMSRLESVLRDGAHLTAGELTAAVIDATRAFAGKESYDDDVTLVVVKRSA